MMMGIIIKQVAGKLDVFLDENNGEYNVSPSWVNNWLRENNSDLNVTIVGKDGNRIEGATVLITKEDGT
jgi:hypothetical protein